MTDEQKDIAWLDHFVATDGWAHRVRSIKSRLARPVMPEEPSDDMKEAMRRAFDIAYLNSDFIGAIYSALYAHMLPKVATKTVEVWRVEFTWHDDPRVVQCRSRESAEVTADEIRTRGRNNHCIRVTGPFKQEAPRD